VKIAMVAYSFYEMDNRVRRYAESLAGEGHDVEVYSLRKPQQPRHGELNGVKILRIQQRVVNENGKFDYLRRVTSFLFRSTAALSWRGLRRRYDLVHVHSVPDFEVFATLPLKLRATRVILDIHDLVPEFYASKFNRGTGSGTFRMLLAIEKLCCAYADHVIAANHIWGERLVARSVRRPNCTTFLNYPDPRVFARARTRPRQPSDDFVLMYPGTLARHQGLDIAVRAMPVIRREVPNAVLQIYGKGPQKEELQQLRDELNLQDCVRINAPIPMEEVVERMRDADLGIVPKRADDFGNEAFSTKILEFMSLNVPLLVAATRIDTLYFNDKLVRFFAPGNVDDFARQAIDLARNELARTQLASNGEACAVAHSWTQKKQDYFDLVEDLTGKPVRASSPSLKQAEADDADRRAA
jgi:glycosyltransferase involved in cell wall biosynthesis